MEIQISDQTLSAPQMGREVMRYAQSVDGSHITFRAGTYAVSCDGTATAVAALARKLQKQPQWASNRSATFPRGHGGGSKFNPATYRQMIADGEIANAAQYAAAAERPVVFRKIIGGVNDYTYGLLSEPEEVPGRPGLYSGFIETDAGGLEAVIIDQESGYSVGRSSEGNKKAKRAAAIEDAARYSDERIRQRREELGATGFQLEAWEAVLNG